MSQFKTIQQAVVKQFETMKDSPLFLVDVSKDEMWDTYLNSFPEGTNTIFNERTEHDCNCCRSFIKTVGNLVTIKDNKIISIWDVTLDNFYQEVADAMSQLVKSAAIRDVFLHETKKVGSATTRQLLSTGNVIDWNHFYLELPRNVVIQGDLIPTRLGDMREDKKVLKRSLEEISQEAIDIVLDLINQKSLYRGDEFKSIVKKLSSSKKAYDKVPEEEKDNYLWLLSQELKGAGRFRNTVIGTLLVDISEGVDLDKAVASFESKVAPTNYKRTSAVVTKGMIQKAEKAVTEMGLMEALPRRHATMQDITINNVLFADREVKVAKNVFEEMANKASTKKPKNLDKIEEVQIETFIKEVLPKVDTIEMLMENNHISNLFSLIAPVDASANNMLKWSNNFSWSYNGDVTDSIKEKVKAAGGSVVGDFRASLSWFNYDDLDLSVREPNGNTIYYGNKRRTHPSSGKLDVDMNAAAGGQSRNAVENIIYSNKNKMPKGTYKVMVHNYHKRETKDVGFTVELEFGGKILSYHYDKAVNNDQKIIVAEVHYDGKEFTIKESLPSTDASKNVWGIDTNKFHKVQLAMYSPNHWDDNEVGNKHYLFVLDGCKNDDTTRGFYNEFLRNDLNEHRKVFEMLSSKMAVQPSEQQLSGLGFSSTQRNSVTCKVSGSFTRLLKINF